MELVGWWKVVVTERYAQFGGRASRPEYWWFFLGTLILIVLLVTLARVSFIFAILEVLAWLALIVPSIAVAVRRLHDTGRSGLWVLICLVPVLGYLVLIVLLTLPGDRGPNRYGAPPAWHLPAA